MNEDELTIILASMIGTSVGWILALVDFLEGKLLKRPNAGDKV